MWSSRGPRRGLVSPAQVPTPGAHGEARIAGQGFATDAHGEAGIAGTCRNGTHGKAGIAGHRSPRRGGYRRQPVAVSAPTARRDVAGHEVVTQSPRRGGYRRRPAVLVAVAAAAVLAVTACATRPLVPPTVQRHHTVTASPAAAAAVTPPVLGVDLYVQRDYPPGALYVDGARDLAYIHGQLDAGAVGLVWNYYASGNQSDKVEDTPITLTPAGVGTLTRLAEKDGLEVQYRPLIRVGRREKWEGAILPADQAVWFQSLWRAELPYLRVAQRLHVASFVVATEMEYMNSAPGWRGFLERARRVFHGQVTMSLWDGDYLKRQVPAGLPQVGMDPYPDTGLPDSASQRQVDVAWRRVFAAVPASVREATTLDEVGFISEDGAYSAPQRWHRLAPVDYELQARWFTAVCRTVAYYHMAGLFFYDMNLAINPAVPNVFPGFFAARPGAAAITRCAQILRS
jgi:hypothetical protein